MSNTVGNPVLLTGRLDLWLVVCVVIFSLAGCATGPRERWDRVVAVQQMAERARQAEAQGDHDRAERLLLQAAKDDSSDVEVRRHLARLLLKRGAVPQAVEQLWQVARNSPESADGFVQLARVLIEHGMPEQAAGPLNAALLRDPDHIVALMLQGRLEEQRRQHDRAREIYHRVLQREPDNVPAALRLATLHLRNSRAEQAAPLMRAVSQNELATSGQRAEAAWLLGIAYGQERRWLEGEQSLQLAIQTMPQPTADHWYRLAQIQQQAGRSAEAMRSLQVVLEMDPGHAEATELATVIKPNSVFASRNGSTIVPVGHTVTSQSTTPSAW